MRRKSCDLLWLQKASDVWNSSDLTYTFDATTVGNVTNNVTGELYYKLCVCVFISCMYIVGNVVLTSNGLFSENVDKGGSYMCKAPQNITFNSAHIHYYINATVGIVDLQVQAFMTQDEKGQFSPGKAILMLCTYLYMTDTNLIAIGLQCYFCGLVNI